MKPIPFIVTGLLKWRRYTGYRASEAYLVGQITRIQWGHITAYVRENLRLNDSFMIPSTARLGITGNGKRCTPLDHYGRSVLELACPADVWDQIARDVMQADALGRPVVRNRHWTTRTASTQFAERSE